MSRTLLHLGVATLFATTPLAGQVIGLERPFGTVREQAQLQQQWLEQRLDNVLPMLMREHGIEMGGHDEAARALASLAEREQVAHRVALDRRR